MGKPPPPVFPAPSAARMRADWRHLCRDIGERRAGSPGERQAIRYLAERFASAGLTVECEPVPCCCLAGDSSAVAVKWGSRWRACEAHSLVGSPSTPGGKAVEGEIVWLEYPESAHRLGPNSLRHQVAALFGPLPTDATLYRRLIAARPAAVLHIDDRLPFAWAKGDALYPYWVRKFGAVPTVSVPYRAAWEWRNRGLTHIRVKVAPRHVSAVSANVVATLPGSDPSAPRLLLGAHHDTQPFNAGADDNASAVVCLLEMARLLADRPRRRRTIQFISFTAEEQLSVGAAHFVRRHRREMETYGVIVNLDAISSSLGHTWLVHSAQAGLGAYFQSHWRRRGYDTVLHGEAMPFGDHFPFSVYGVPAVCLYRPNVHGGMRWQHHSRHDTLANVSIERTQALIAAVAPSIDELAGSRTLPFRRNLAAAGAAEAAHFARTLYGLPV